MMKKVLPLFLFFFFALVSCSFAQSRAERDVQQAIETLRKAMIDADSAALDRLTHPGLNYGHSSGRIEDKATFIRSLVSGTSDFLTMELSDQTITVADDAATVRHTLSAEINDNGNKGTVKLAVLLVWVKEKGKWKLLARQAVRV